MAASAEENTRVRLAELADLSELARLDPWPSANTWRRKIEAGEVTVLECANKIAGLARYTMLWTTVSFMGLVWIAESYRGRGYSRKLLRFLIQHLKAQGAVALLSSSQTDEPEAQRWHAHMGFHTNGIIENIADDNVGEIVYRLEL